MIDHLTMPVGDIAVSRAFYETALAPLGLTVFAEDGPAVGFGVDSWVFGIEEVAASAPLHLAFAARSEAEVRAFHAAALDAGGRDNGTPGPRAAYGPGYFAAFVLDPDGHNIEAVWHGS